MSEPASEQPIAGSGTVFLEHLAVYRELVGEAPVQEALASVPREIREAYESCVPGAWIDVNVSGQLYTTIARAAGRDPVDLHGEVVRIGYGRALTGLWRALIMRLATDRALVARAPTLYAKTFDGGEMRGVLEGPGDATFDIVGWPDMPEIHQVGIASGMRTVLELCGRNPPSITRAPTPAGVRYRVRWS